MGATGWFDASSLAAFVTSIAALIASLAAYRNSKKNGKKNGPGRAMMGRHRAGGGAGAGMAGGPIEQKAAAAPFATLVGGYLAAILIEAVPWLKANLTADQKFNLPIIIAFALSALAGYFAPHTHRADLAARP